MIIQHEQKQQGAVAQGLGGSTIGIVNDAQSMQMMVRMMTKNLYSDPIGSICREYISNAADANKENNSTEPIMVYFDESESGLYYCVRDYGKGLCQSDIELYTNLLSSSKRNSNDLIGGFGIGMKSAFSYTEEFFIDSYYEGTITKYILYVDPMTSELKRDMLHTEEFKEDSKTGIEIRIPIKHSDKDNFKTKTFAQTCFFENLYYDFLENNFTIFKQKTFSYIDQNYTRFHKMGLLLGPVRYPISDDLIRKHNLYNMSPNICLRFEIGELSVVPNREQIIWDEKSVNAFEEKLERFKQELTDQLIENNKAITHISDFVKVGINYQYKLSHFDGSQVTFNCSSIIDNNVLKPYITDFGASERLFDAFISSRIYAEKFFSNCKNYLAHQQRVTSAYLSLEDIINSINFTDKVVLFDDYKRNKIKTLENNDVKFQYIIDKSNFVLSNTKKKKLIKFILKKIDNQDVSYAKTCTNRKLFIKHFFEYLEWWYKQIESNSIYLDDIEPTKPERSSDKERKAKSESVKKTWGDYKVTGMSIGTRFYKNLKYSKFSDIYDKITDQNSIKKFIILDRDDSQSLYSKKSFVYRNGITNISKIFDPYNQYILFKKYYGKYDLFEVILCSTKLKKYILENYQNCITLDKFISIIPRYFKSYHVDEYVYEGVQEDDIERLCNIYSGKFNIDLPFEKSVDKTTEIKRIKNVFPNCKIVKHKHQKEHILAKHLDVLNELALEYDKKIDEKASDNYYIDENTLKLELFNKIKELGISVYTDYDFLSGSFSIRLKNIFQVKPKEYVTSYIDKIYDYYQQNQ